MLDEFGTILPRRLSIAIQCEVQPGDLFDRLQERIKLPRSPPSADDSTGQDRAEARDRRWCGMNGDLAHRRLL